MIIYPIIILILLLAAFIIIWRKAYLVESGGEQIIKEKPIKEEDFKKQVEEDLEEQFGKQEEEFQPRSAPAEITVTPTKPELSENLQKAEELLHKKQYISAERWYLEALKEDPKNPLIYSRLGVIYIEQKNYADAREALETAVKLDSNIPSRYFNLSFAYNADGDRRMAIYYAKKALRLEPENDKYKSWLEELKNKPF